MAKELELSNTEKKFIVDLLAQNQRLDGRKSLLETRNLNIQINPDTYGDVYVSLITPEGKVGTRVHCKITADIVKPKEKRPFEGSFYVNCEINGLTGLQFENYSKPNSISAEGYYTRFLESMILRSNALDLEQLCIIAGEKVWDIRLDLHVLEYDGGFLECASIACLTSLLHFKRPYVEVQNEKIHKVYTDLDDRDGVNLGVLHIPIAVKFNIFQQLPTEELIKQSNNTNSGKELVVIDCTVKEEMLSNGELLVALNKNREIVQFDKPGGVPLQTYRLLELANMALPMVDEITNKILKAIEVDEKKRNKYAHLLSAENDRYDN
ncbi:hypothetical protein FOG51_01801 [Hanseniaspora uvarum]|nr:hypothetical protein FOG48_00206 [Hanseniaspora uvarum]KAF0273299.1 hypothetical protein FOG51_01801 [Hanseniaspora uvarum]KAF0278300.1 hypothetical protein FOG50_00866 [Hanseniaspora uvarum]KKA03521.1 Exosome complex component HuRRP45 [Hanseniaspora uvarum DSM 2768]GMM40941.1 exosome non-catalytic core subunit [Hanseniaspora uvarum]